MKKVLMVVHFVVLLASCIQAIAATPSLNMGSPAIQGNVASFKLTLANTQGTSISGVETRILFDPEVFSTASAVIGAAATAAGKQISQSVVQPSTLHLALLGGTTTIGDGVVAQVNFTLKPGADPANSLFRVYEVLATDPSGSSVIITTGSSSYTVPSHTLSVLFAGSGGGTVTSSPTGIAANVNISHQFASGTLLTLSASHASYSLFSGWSGGRCSGTGSCVFTISADSSVTATFNKDSAYSVRIDTPTIHYYSSLSAAYLAAVSPATIKAWGTDFSGTVNLNQNKAITLIGGYNDGYTSNAGFSTIHGSLKISRGSLRVQKLEIR